MIVKSAAGVQADIDVTIDGVPVDYSSVMSMELEVEEGLHDTATLEIAGLPPRAITEYLSRPVKVRVSTGASFVHEFYGTVEIIKPVSATRDGLINGSPFQVSSVVCMGASYRMRGKRSQVWDSASLTDMAVALADKYGFSVTVPNSSLLLPRYVQAGTSDWAALKDYASMYGYSVNLHGTHLHIYDPAHALSHNRSLHKLATITRSSLKPVPGQIMEFKAEVAKRARDGSEYNFRVHVDNGADSYVLDSQTVFGSTDRPLYEDDDVHTVGNYDEALAAVHSARANTYDLHGNVKCSGTAGVYPGGVVELDRYNSDLDGMWYVGRAKHVVHSNAFMTDLAIYRDLSDSLGTTPVQSFRRHSPPTIDRGVWKSSQKEVQRYGIKR